MNKFKIIEDEFNQLNFEQRNPNISIKLNKVFIEILKFIGMRLSKSSHWIEETKCRKEIFNFSRKLNSSILLDEHLNGRFPKLLEKMKNVSEKLRNE